MRESAIWLAGQLRAQGQIAEVGLTLIAAAVVLEIIFGSAVPYIGIGILDNITALTTRLGQDGLTGIIAIGIIIWLYLRR